MPKPAKTASLANRTNRKGSEGPAKKNYTSPQLITYGDLRRLTQAKGGSNPDGAGNPASKNPPM
jgi:hypothetical protein